MAKYFMLRLISRSFELEISTQTYKIINKSTMYISYFLGTAIFKGLWCKKMFI